MIIFPTTDGRKFYQYTPDFRIGRTCVLTKYMKKSQKSLAEKQVVSVGIRKYRLHKAAVLHLHNTDALCRSCRLLSDKKGRLIFTFDHSFNGINGTVVACNQQSERRSVRTAAVKCERMEEVSVQLGRR